MALITIFRTIFTRLFNYVLIPALLEKIKQINITKTLMTKTTKPKSEALEQLVINNEFLKIMQKQLQQNDEQPIAKLIASNEEIITNAE